MCSAVVNGFMVHRKFTALKMQSSDRDMIDIGQTEEEEEVTLDELFSEVEQIDLFCR